MQNLRYAFRKLLKSPTFTLTAVLTLGIGIGANTAIFSVVYDVLFKPLRYPQPQQLVTIQESIKSGQADFPSLPVNANHFVYWREHAKSFSGLAALLPESMPVGSRQPEEVGVAQETANLFSVLGVSPRLGRAFTAEEEQPGHSNVVILADSLWRRRCGADPAIIGKTLTLDGRPYEVIGVMPADFTLPSSRVIGGGIGTAKVIEAFVPFGWSADVLHEVEGDHNYFAIGRLKAGITPRQAASELNVLQRAISEQTPDKVHYGAAVTALQEFLTGSSRGSLLLLLGAVGAVLLISCINIANLLLTRAAGSAHEAVVRAALGASRTDLIRNALAEPLLLSLSGCAVGMLLAVLGVPILLRNVPTELPRLNEVHVDAVALGFAILISAVTALLCGMLPAWRYAHDNRGRALRTESRGSSEPRSAKRLQSGLIITEVAASAALVITAGLLITSMIKLLHVDRGFQTQNVVTAQVLLPDSRYADKPARNMFYDRALSGLHGLPGVESAGAISVLPLDGDNWGDLVTRTGDTRPVWQRPDAHFRWITPGYFETLQVPLLAGRFLADSDQGRSVAVVSKQVARMVWPGQSAIGQRFTRMDPDEKPFEVIGIVDDIRSLDLSQPPPPMVYVPYWYRSREVGTFVIRTGRDPEKMISAVRKAIWSIDSQVAVTSIQTMNAVVSGSVATRRFEMELLLAFAISALLLAGLGVYGVVAYSAVRRRREIGIRMALGADIPDVYRLILQEGIAPVFVGALTGIGLAWIAGRFLASLLFEVSASNPWIAAVAGLILMVVGVAACFLPARRAARIEPVQALHYE